jgi:hypothetical protein
MGGRRRVRGLIVLLVVAAATLSGSVRAYEPDVHFYVVYLLLRSKGYTAVDSQQFAGFSQYVDDNARTEPIYCWFPRRAKFHFSESGPQWPTPANAQTARAQVTEAFAQFNAGRWKGRYLIGAALHLFADTYSHQGFTAWDSPDVNTRLGRRVLKIGHWDTADGGHAPDRPHNTPQTALDAASELYQLIPAGGGRAVDWPVLEPLLRNAFSAPSDASSRSAAIAAITASLFPADPKPSYKKLDFALETFWFQWAVL